jgi:hypothetical protein
MPDSMRKAVRLSMAHVSAATTIFLAGAAAVSRGWVIRGLILMGLAVLYLIYELVSSRPIRQNVPGMFRFLFALFACVIFLGINKDTIKGFFKPAPQITQIIPSPTPVPTAPQQKVIVQFNEDVHTSENIPKAKEYQPPSVSVIPHTSPTPPIEDLRQTLESGRLSQGWTLHKRGGLFSIYYVINTDGLNHAVAQAMEKGDISLDQEMSARVSELWKVMPTPKKSTTDIGELKDQEAVEHVFHRLSNSNLEWNCEIISKQTAVDGCPVQKIAIGNLPAFDRKTIVELDQTSVRAANKRYVDALEKVSQ